MQFGDGQWFRGKSLDTFCPVGPLVVPRDELDPGDLRIRQRLNGETLQDSRTSLLIFGIPTLVSYISQAPGNELSDETVAELRGRVSALAAKFPLYPHLGTSAAATGLEAELIGAAQ